MADEEMRQANAAAGKEILHSRNAEQGGGAGGTSSKLDLHGLLIEEALEVLQKRLEELSAAQGARRSSSSLTVVTGSGKNSRRGKAKLMPAVRSFLMENHYSFREKSVGADSRGGTFVISIQSGGGYS